MLSVRVASDGRGFCCVMRDEKRRALAGVVSCAAAALFFGGCGHSPRSVATSAGPVLQSEHADAHAALPVEGAGVAGASLGAAASSSPALSPVLSPALSSTSAIPDASPPAVSAVQLSPFIRVDRGAGFVEIDGAIAIDVHGATPKVYLEVLVCSPNSREHESLVLTKARASDVHAALLLLGIEPGSPGAFTWQGQQLVSVAPTGPALGVLVQPEGAAGWVPILDWVISPTLVKQAAPVQAGVTDQGSALEQAKPPRHASGFLFAGSTFRSIQGQEVYTGDAEGTIVGLATFGTETVAFATVHNPDASTEQPHLIADAAKLPKHGTSVKVRLMKIDPSRP